MSLAAAGDRVIARAIERSDFWRRSPASVGGHGGHKEWSYFCLPGRDVDLIVNLSIMDRGAVSAAAGSHAEVARVAMLARTPDGQWHGGIDTCDPARVGLRAGRIDARLGATSLAFEGGSYHLDARVDGEPLRATLLLNPIARPALARSVPLGSHEPMQWQVVPRLEATGELSVDGRRYPIRRCPAYHDHNWGRFTWGGDFAWEWGIALAGGPVAWTLIYYRITDRGRHRTVSQGVLLWRDDRHSRSFRDAAISVRSAGLLGGGRPLRIPRIMSLAIPGTAADIPRRLEIEARNGHDALDITVDLSDCAQIGIPNDSDDGITTISECRAWTRVSGCIRGDTVRFDGPSIVELNRAA